MKTQLKEQNQRLLSVTQEKARLEAKNKINQMKEEDGVGKSSFTIIKVHGLKQYIGKVQSSKILSPEISHSIIDIDQLTEGHAEEKCAKRELRAAGRAW